MASTTLRRAFDKFAPQYRYIAEIPGTANMNYTVTSLRQAKAAIVDGLDPTDPDGWDARKALAEGAIAELDRMIEAKSAAMGEAARSARPVGGQERSSWQGGGWGGAPMLRDVHTGRAIRTYSAREPIASDGGEPDWGVGDMVRAAVTGDWNRLPSHMRAGSAGVGSAGGFLIPSEMAGFVVDLARAKARVMEAGAITVPMTAGNLQVATVTGDPAPGWRGEGKAFPVSQGSYGSVMLTTKVLGVIVPLTLELVMSASNVNELVMSQLTAQMALKLDAAAIAGDGTQDTPRGINVNIPTKNVVTLGAPATTGAYTNWSKAIGKVLAANADAEKLAILHNSDVVTAMDSFVDTTGQPVQPPPSYAKIRDAGREYVANGIATSGSPAATYSLVGDFSQVLFGMQQSLMLEVSREGTYTDTSGTTSAFGNGMVLIRAMMMLDVAILQPSFFAKVDDIRIT
ncbi:phage major capsid protein [Novosphingobium sp.]|uniref:phage major capsid protein n=1 Tax=Novosphingobium sp. TaxID=1874826 RepID=UPI00260277B1|nr:phage major capsid protein [Novosphingobium sp.]